MYLTKRCIEQFPVYLLLCRRGLLHSIKDPNYGACLIQSPVTRGNLLAFVRKEEAFFTTAARRFSQKAKKLSNEKSSVANFRHTGFSDRLGRSCRKNVNFYVASLIAGQNIRSITYYEVGHFDGLLVPNLNFDILRCIYFSLVANY